jgi:predicted AAA+ superfamily ATPase
MTASLDQRLRAMPAMVVTGARQTGKSTLVKMQPPESRPYYSLDDIGVLDLARRNPEVLVEGYR